MKVEVRVIPRAKKAKVEASSQGLKVYLNSPAEQGRANKELIKVLAGYYKTKKYNITIIKGDKQRNKIVQIEE